MLEVLNMKNKSVSIKLKIKIIHEVEAKIINKTNIAMKYGIAKSILSTILKYREKLIELEKQQKVSIYRLRFKEAKYPHLEHKLFLWIKSAINSNIAVSSKIIKAQATIFAKNMNII